MCLERNIFFMCKNNSSDYIICKINVVLEKLAYQTFILIGDVNFPLDKTTLKTSKTLARFIKSDHAFK